MSFWGDGQTEPACAPRVFLGGEGIGSAGTEKKLLSFEQCVFCEKKEEATSDFFLLSVREGGRGEHA